jgi:O-antigen/teichoic acid export membrane protein
LSTESIYKQILKGTGTYSISVMGSRMASFFMLPVYTRFLTTADYGVLELLELTTFVFVALAGMRIGDALFYYYSAACTAETKERAVCTVLLGAALMGLLGGLVGWNGASMLSRLVFQTERYAPGFRLVFTTFAFSVPLEAGFCYLRALNRPSAYVTASLLRLSLGIACNMLLLAQGLGMYAMLWSSLIVTVIMAVWLGGRALAGISIPDRFDWNLLQHFLRYSAPLGVSALAMLVINYGDRFFLQRYCSLSDLGVYALAYKFGMVITYIQMPFDVYWRSQMFTIVQEPNGETVYVRMATYLTLGLTFVALLLTLIIEPLLRLTVPASFQSAAQYVPWIAVAYVIRTIGGHFRCVFLLKGTTGKEFQVAMAGGIACLVGYAELIPNFKLWGAVASTALGFGTMFVIGLWQAQKLRRFTFEYRRMILGVLAALAIGAVFAAARPNNPWMALALGTLGAACYPLMLRLTAFAHPDELADLHAIFGVPLKRAVLRLRMGSQRA